MHQAWAMTLYRIEVAVNVRLPERMVEPAQRKSIPMSLQSTPWTQTYIFDGNICTPKETHFLNDLIYVQSSFRVLA